MFILGIEAATPVASVAVAAEGKILAERMVNNQRTHSVNLLPMIRDTLLDCGVNKKDLSGIAVSIGPGSFTGLRIGMSTAKTLAQVLNLKVAGIPTLDVLAYPLSGLAGLICPVLNARKSELYAALYGWDNGQQVCLKPAFASGVKQLAELLLSYNQQVTFLGDGLTEYQSELNSLMGDLARFAPKCASFPRGAVVAEIGLARFTAGQCESPMHLLPKYVRKSEAEIKWQERCRSGHGQC
ncbi:tRNA threonylcarbamoyladenosine biosynthesis protein TsaB [Desulfotomaculum arcticum]|uniref:tRNA threonylcarbamoyladenosine biosynthesis protein TsaB n=1 Tax=Desulfotruncus arcticus DSM 17038 TaxID=1121424 RepID=A0A1I2N4K6_9FIRM|nr:tRNA (adenosine(37)-N6)-threonylcarbamoyltransferase complex dimerization subunit type 1 TsaB [Desulfotruncus arcticus]SFF98774.1 tRNA threonylcarbamoyladenosine biosynthesis protein TsaB [Desulfotomaculum arcticum] [Desulfotruncus arcticus DSM 17038]